MTRAMAAALLLALSACSEPRLTAGVSISPNGVAVNPGVSARLGAARIRISP